MEDERHFLDYEAAVAMLPDRDKIHTFIAAGAMIGADWRREAILDLMRESACELAGPIMAKMGHRLVVWRGDKALFVETKDNLEHAAP